MLRPFRRRFYGTRLYQQMSVARLSRRFRFPGAQGERLLPGGGTGVLMLLALNLLMAGVAPGGRAANAQLH
jgi:hypothetical protein